MNAIPSSALACTGQWQGGFLAVLPTIITHARIRFRMLRPERKEEAIAESVAAAYVNYAELAGQGKLSRASQSTLADFAARHVAEHRHVGGSQSSCDVLSTLARRRRGFRLQHLGLRQDYDNLRPLVVERRGFSPADVAAFRIDFAQWLMSFPRRDRKIMKRMIAGDGTFDVADRFGISPGRVSQLRRKYERSWAIFQGLDNDARCPARAA